MNKCKICDKDTKNTFNINSSAIHICEECAALIFIQQAQWYNEIMQISNKIRKKRGN